MSVRWRRLSYFICYDNIVMEFVLMFWCCDGVIYVHVDMNVLEHDNFAQNQAALPERN